MKKIRVWCSVLGLALLGGVGEAAPASVPLTLQAVFEENNWLVPVWINDPSEVGWMVVDTGAETTYCANEFLPLGVSRSAVTGRAGAVGGTMTTVECTIPAAHVGPLTLTQWTVRAIGGRQISQLSTKRWVVGNLGADVWRRFIVHLDPLHTSLILFPREAVPASGVEWWPTKMAGPMPSVEVRLGGLTCWAAVDTGGGSGLKIKYQALQDRLMPVLDRPPVDGGLSSLAGEGQSRLAGVPAMTLGGLVVDHPLVEFLRLPGSPSEASIGVDLLAHIGTWWDLEGKRFGVDAAKNRPVKWVGDDFDYASGSLERLLQSGKWEDAASACLSFVVKYPSQGEYVIPRQIACWQALKQPEKVEAKFKELLVPGCPSFFWALRARVYASENQYPRMLEAYATAVHAGFPEDGLVLLHNQYLAYLAAGKKPEAFVVTQKAARRYPWESWTSDAFNLELYVSGLGKWKSAVSLFEMPTAMSGGKNGRLELAAVYANAGRVEDAFKVLTGYRADLEEKLKDPKVVSWWQNLKNQPAYAVLKDDPRLLKLLEVPASPAKE